MSRFFAILLCPFLALLLIGCGGGPSLTPVSGKVTAGGAAVKGGTLTFSPVGEGKPGTAEIKDGAFTVKTAGAEGAVVGKHKLTFTPPPQDLTEEQLKDPKFKAPPPLYQGFVPKESEVNISSGTNNLEIQLVPKR